MLLRGPHHQRRENVKLPTGPSDGLVEGNVFGNFPATRIDTTIPGAQCESHLVQAKSAERRSDADWRQRKRNHDLARKIREIWPLRSFPSDRAPRSNASSRAGTSWRGGEPICRSTAAMNWRRRRPGQARHRASRPIRRSCGLRRAKPGRHRGRLRPDGHTPAIRNGLFRRGRHSARRRGATCVSAIGRPGFPGRLPCRVGRSPAIV